MALGRRDAGPDADDYRRLAEDLAYFGATPEAVDREIARLRGLEPEVAEAMVVHPDNATAVRLFCALASQWRTVAVSTMSRAEVRRTGLDYGAVEPVARMAGLVLGPDDFTRLRVMEAEALKAWAEERR